MVASWISRIFLDNSSSVALSFSPELPSTSWPIIDKIDWVMTISPTKLTTLSIFTVSTRIEPVSFAALCLAAGLTGFLVTGFAFAGGALGSSVKKPNASSSGMACAGVGSVKKPKPSSSVDASFDSTVAVFVTSSLPGASSKKPKLSSSLLSVVSALLALAADTCSDGSSSKNPNPSSSSVVAAGVSSEPPASSFNMASKLALPSSICCQSMSLSSW